MHNPVSAYNLFENKSGKFCSSRICSICSKTKQMQTDSPTHRNTETEVFMYFLLYRGIRDLYFSRNGCIANEMYREKGEIAYQAQVN